MNPFFNMSSSKEMSASQGARGVRRGDKADEPATV